MRKYQLIFGLALTALMLASTTTFAAPGPLVEGPQDAPNAVVVSYDPGTGVLSAAGNGVTMSSFQLESASGAFVTGNVPGEFNPGPFDVVSANKLFTLRTGGVTELQLGAALPTGMGAPQLIADLLIDGSLLPAGNFDGAEGGGPFLFVVPEPSTALLSICGLLGMVAVRRRKS